MSNARGEHLVVNMRVISMIIVKRQHSLILICSRMKELTFSRFIHPRPKWLPLLAFYRKISPFEEELRFFQRWQPIVELVCHVTWK